MKQKSGFIVFALLILHIASAQADTYTCPQSFKVVKTGDSMETVKAGCGAPMSETVRTDPVNTVVQAVRWFYGIRPNPRSFPIPVFSVSFRDQKVIQIDKNNVFSPVLGTFSCLIGDMLKPGQTMSDVMSMCGPPTSSSSTETSISSTKPVVIWIYDLGQFHQKVLFEFEDAKLARIKRS
jgi:hypothetical protein